MLTLILASGAMAMTLFAAMGLEFLYQRMAKAPWRPPADAPGNGSGALSSSLNLERDFGPRF